jgi:predicted aldo/keto reductase-like oxidoreductase
MIYRQLGKTGLEVSQLGFGAMRLPMKGEGKEAKVDRDLAVPMIHRAFEAGVNYIDSAVGYCNSDSQCAIGDALKGWRDKIVVSTKNHDYGEDESVWWKHLEDSLERLQIDCIDIYNHHGIKWTRYVEHVEPRVGKWMMKARDQGLIRHICTSFHDDNDALMKLVDSGYPAVITLQYNLLDRQLEEGIAHAHEKGIGIVVMGPVGGGRLGATSEVLESLVPGIERVPELALRFVLANPNVTVALSGMSTMQQVEENIATASDGSTLSEDDRAAIREHAERLSEMAKLYCTGCGYCMPCEAASVNIPGVLGAFIQGKVYGLWDHARKAYVRIQKGAEDRNQTAEACVECGKCEEQCPQKIEIRELLKAAHERLG